MRQLSVNGEQTLALSYGQVFDALLRVLPEMGLQLGHCDREDGIVTATPSHRLVPAGELVVNLSRVSEAQTRVAVESRLLRFNGAAHVARHERSIRRLLAKLAGGSPEAALTVLQNQGQSP